MVFKLREQIRLLFYQEIANELKSTCVKRLKLEYMEFEPYSPFPVAIFVLVVQLGLPRFSGQ